MNLQIVINRISPLAFSLLCVFALSACNGHENPLAKLPAKDVASWIYKHKTADIISCSQSEWSKADKTNTTTPLCEKTSKELASSMKGAGFGDVLAHDVLLGTIWVEFEKQVRVGQANHYSAEKTHKIFDTIKTKKPAEKGVAP
jgi:hypothetical protein